MTIILQEIIKWYYMRILEIKDFNALIHNKEEAHQKLVEKSRNDDYPAGNLLDFSHQQNKCKLTVTDLSRQTNTSIPQHINFVGKLEEDDGATMFLIPEKL